MKFDDILSKYVGDFGLYQKIQIVLVCCPVLFLALHSLSWNFTGSSMKRRCLLHDENFDAENSSSSQFHSQNSLYEQWYANHTSVAKCSRPKSLTSNLGELEPCLDGYKWDSSEIKSSVTKRWNLACDRKWLRAFVHSFYYVGQFCGSFVFGILADKFGRKPAFFVAIGLQVISGSLIAVVPHWSLFAFLVLNLGFAHPGIQITAVVMSVEMVGPSKRMLSTAVATFFYALGQIILAALGYFIRSYEYLQLAMSLPALIFISYWWLVPESARWLVTHDKVKEAYRILKRMSKVNRRKLPNFLSNDQSLIRNLKYEERKNEKRAQKESGHRKWTFLDMVATPNVRKHTLILFFCWPVVSMPYYGLSINPSFMGGNKYAAVAFGGLFEMLAAFILFTTLNLLGRKFHCFAGFIFAGSCIFLSTIVHNDFQIIKMLCISLGRMAIATVYGVLYVWTPELYPTSIRMTAVGLCSMMARIGGVMASYVFLWIADIYPTIIASSVSIVCVFTGILILLLPDTNGQPQPETIDEVEILSKAKRKMFIFGWNVSPKRQIVAGKVDIDDNVDIKF